MNGRSTLVFVNLLFFFCLDLQYYQICCFLTNTVCRWIFYFHLYIKQTCCYCTFSEVVSHLIIKLLHWECVHDILRRSRTSTILTLPPCSTYTALSTYRVMTPDNPCVPVHLTYYSVTYSVNYLVQPPSLFHSSALATKARSSLPPI